MLVIATNLKVVLDKLSHVCSCLHGGMRIYERHTHGASEQGGT